MELAGAITTQIPSKQTSSGFRLPVYGLGTWGIGGTFTADRSEDSQAIEAIRRCITAGVTHIDTAEMYGAGHAEDLVGQAIRGVPRDQLIIGSKALAHHLRFDDLLRSAEASIARMNCDYLDIYMIHHPTDDIPIRETMGGMDELIQRGLIRHIGVSNFTKERLQKASAATDNPIVLNQVHYSLTVREPERTGLLDYCQKNGVLLVAWQPIDRAIYSGGNSPALNHICQKYHLTPVQAALSWLISQPGVAAISKTLSAKHLHENLQACAVQISPEDIEELRRHFEHQRECSEVYTLK